MVLKHLKSTSGFWLRSLEPEPRTMTTRPPLLLLLLLPSPASCAQPRSLPCCSAWRLSRPTCLMHSHTAPSCVRCWCRAAWSSRSRCGLHRAVPAAHGTPCCHSLRLSATPCSQSLRRSQIHCCVSNPLWAACKGTPRAGQCGGARA